MNRSDLLPNSDSLGLLKSPVFQALSTFSAVWILSHYLSPHSAEKQALIRSAVLQLILVLGIPLVATQLAGLQVLQIFRLHPTSARNLLLTLAATPCLIVFLDEVSFLQSRWTGQENDLLTQFLQAISLGQWIKLGVCMAVIPAVCEESLFRGYLLDRLSIQDQQWRAIMVSSVLFGLFHQGFQMVVPAALAGVFFAFVAARTESLFNPIASHSVVNAWALLAANSGLQKRSGHLPFVLLAICFVGILLLGSLLRKGK